MPKLNFTPINNRLLIQPLAPETITKGGIVIPDSAQEKAQRGVVAAVGPGLYNDNGTLRPMQIKKGDKVLYGKYAGTETTIDDVDYLIMLEGDVFGTVK